MSKLLYKKTRDIINNIYKISELVGNSKNVSIEAKLIDNKRFVIDDTVVNILSFEDSTGVINALLISDKEDYIRFKINCFYRVRGNITILDKEKIKDFSELISKLNIINYFVVDMKLLCVRSIQPIENKPVINYIELSLYHNNYDDLFHIKLPQNIVESCEINKISTSIIYFKKGNYDEINTCGSFEIKLLLDKMNSKDIKLLSEDINIFSVGIYFNDENKKYYNLPYYYKNKTNICLQVKNKNNRLIIYMDDDLKCQFIK